MEVSAGWLVTQVGSLIGVWVSVGIIATALVASALVLYVWQWLDRLFAILGR
jgi:hypothetical protein